jgi:hypothetical protein
MISSLSGGLSLINILSSNILSANHLGISSANHMMANQLFSFAKKQHHNQILLGSRLDIFLRASCKFYFFSRQ